MKMDSRITLIRLLFSGKGDAGSGKSVYAIKSRAS